MADNASTTLDPADQEKQEAFVRIFFIVLIALSAFTIFCMMVARLMAGIAPSLQDDPILKADLMSRISPVGQVRTTADADSDASGEATVVAAQSGEDIVNGVCAGCHLSGVAGAPLLDDEAAWAERRSLGLDALTASVINGKGAMPARAGTDHSDDELRRAVAHMVGLESEDAAATEGGDERAAASDESASTDASTEEAESAAAGSDSDAAATEEASGADAAADESASQTASTAATAAAASATAASGAAAATKLDDAASGAGGEMQVAEASARVKGVADGICAACHLSGVGGAPKIGDTAAWQQRAEKGLAAQVEVVAAGLGAMPPRGGSDLSDEELASAIVYMMNK